MDRDRFIYKKKLDIKWLLKMAWRDSRRNRLRLLLFISSITLGIAALVATFSLGDNVQKNIDDQARELVGADLVIESNRPVNAAIQPLLDSIGQNRSQERSFASMVYFTKSGGTRLVQVKALKGQYPYYGSLQTTPGNAGITFRNKQEALVDKTLMLQFDAKVGDTVQVGDLKFKIAGILNKAPGRNGFSTTMAPPVYIPLQYLEQTGLVQKGSRVSYSYYYQYPAQTDIKKAIEGVRPLLDKEGLDIDTVEERKNNTGRAFEDFNRFLTLISFIALLLGCIGVASSVQIYMREKISSIAILRCMGANGVQSFLIWLIQICIIGLIGSVAGAALGVVIQQLLPAVVKDFLPIQLTTALSWSSIMKGIGTGLLLSLLFALLPLISIRNISPLITLRLSLEPQRSFKDPVRWLVYGLIIFFIAAFTSLQMQSAVKAIFFTAGILISFAVLVAVASSLKWAVRRFFPSSWNYLWRQGFANLYRPNNQTVILISTIGLGAAFIGTLYFVQSILINRVTLSGSGSQPNMVLFDIQSSQKNEVANLTTQYKLPLLQQVPIVTMRIEEINGKNAEAIKKDTTSAIPRWAFENELRVTYRDTLTDSEKLTEGKLGAPVKSANDSIYVSLDERYANALHVKKGDHLIFNVQGRLIQAIVGSFRKVDWQRVQTNFRLIFPTGVLEAAPQFHVIITRVNSPEASAAFQKAVVQKFPNISIIDLGLILSVLDDVLNQIGFVVRFMAGFSICTGLIVLIASVLLSKYQRIQETVLLRTLGASRRQILIITATEYFFLGALAAATGILLAISASWALAVYNFDAAFNTNWWPVVLLFLSISFITVIIGLFNSREVLNKPPLEILVKEI